MFDQGGSIGDREFDSANSVLALQAGHNAAAAHASTN
jgi:hypothetical protein